MSLVQYDKIASQMQCYERCILNSRCPRAAVLLPLIEESGTTHIVFTQRAAHLNIHRGEVAFPGGKFDLDDGNLETTVLRESHEEIGLKARDVCLLGCCSDVISSTGIQVTPFVGAISKKVVFLPNQNELEKIFTVPASFFLEAHCETLVFKRQQRIFNVPSFHFQGHHIWGLTAQILVEFLTIAFDVSFPSFGEQNAVHY